MSVKNTIRPAVVVLFIFSLVTLGQTGSAGVTTEPPPIETMADMEALFAHEPGYREIQQVAMRYAEVHPEKIAAWRRGASLRAFLPRVDYDYDWRGYDQTETRQRLETRHDTSTQWDRGRDSSVQETTYRQYDERDRSDWDETQWDLRDRWQTRTDEGWSSSIRTRDDRGYRTDLDTRDRDSRDTRWRVRLQWDLRDFLYDSDQTRISVEARRLVELRQDVLQEINTYFFDRRRAQIEMLFSPPDDVRSRIDLQLQIARVTASIDALTGGYLSAALEKSRTR